MTRDHMMGWVMPAEPLGPAIKAPTLSKTEREAYRAEDAVRRFETGDHMLPGMKQSDFPKEYDTRVAIEDRFMNAYEKTMREMLVFKPHAKSETATGMRLLREQAETWRKRAMSEMWDNRKLARKFGW